MEYENPMTDDDSVTRKGDIIVVLILSICVTIPSIAGRLVVRTVVVPYFGIDDVFMILAGVFVVAAAVYSAYTVLADNYGTGQRSYEVTFDELRNFDLSIYIWELGYYIGMMFIKISILTYYQRLQPSRIYQWTLGVVVTGSIAILVAQICQCWPIQNAWNPNEGPHRGTSKSCVNDVALTFFAAVFTIVTDFWIWACCLKMLKNLQVAKRKKAEVIVIFSIGLLACAASIVRLFTIKNFYASDDPTWDAIPIIICSFIEVSLAIVAACLPMNKAGFVRSRAWIRQNKPDWLRTPRFLKRIPVIKASSWVGSFIPRKQKGDDVENGGKAADAPNGVPVMSHPSCLWKKMRGSRASTSVAGTLVDEEKADKGGVLKPATGLSEIGNWGLQNNDFCENLNAQHELPPPAVARDRQQSEGINNYYYESGGGGKGGESSGR